MCKVWIYDENERHWSDEKNSKPALQASDSWNFRFWRCFVLSNWSILTRWSKLNAILPQIISTIFSASPDDIFDMQIWNAISNRRLTRAASKIEHGNHYTSYGRRKKNQTLDSRGERNDLNETRIKNANCLVIFSSSLFNWNACVRTVFVSHLRYANVCSIHIRIFFSHSLEKIQRSCTVLADAAEKTNGLSLLNNNNNNSNNNRRTLRVFCGRHFSAASSASFRLNCATRLWSFLFTARTPIDLC